MIGDDGDHGVRQLLNSPRNLTGSGHGGDPPYYIQLSERNFRFKPSDDQRAVLEAEFLQDDSPDAIRRHELAEELGVSEHKVRTWFQNRFVIGCHVLLNISHHLGSQESKRTEAGRAFSSNLEAV